MLTRKQDRVPNSYANRHLSADSWTKVLETVTTKTPSRINHQRSLLTFWRTSNTYTLAKKKHQRQRPENLHLLISNCDLKEDKMPGGGNLWEGPRVIYQELKARKVGVIRGQRTGGWSALRLTSVLHRLPPHCAAGQVIPWWMCEAEDAAPLRARRAEHHHKGA